MSEALLGLGSNVGDSRELLREAIRRLDESGEIQEVSRVWRSEPVGYRNQDWFLNLAVRWRTGLAPLESLRLIRTIEDDLGRTRDLPNGPRTIDIDILLWDDLQIDAPALTVPHPRMHTRRFVLGPAAEIAPERRHPTFDRTIAELLADLEDEALATPAGALFGQELSGEASNRIGG